MAASERPRTFGRLKVLDFSKIVGYPHHIPHQARERLSKFDGSHEVSAKRHLELFREIIKDLSITHEDVCMKLLASSFKERAEIWFVNLKSNSISGYDMFEKSFLERWGSESDDTYFSNQNLPLFDPIVESVNNQTSSELSTSEDDPSCSISFEDKSSTFESIDSQTHNHCINHKFSKFFLGSPSLDPEEISEDELLVSQSIEVPPSEELINHSIINNHSIPYHLIEEEESGNIDQDPLVVLSHDHCANNQDVLNKFVNFIPDQFSENDQVSSYNFNDESIEGQSQDEDELVNHTRCSNLCSTSYNESLIFSILNQDNLELGSYGQSCPQIVNIKLDQKITIIPTVESAFFCQNPKSNLFIHLGEFSYLQSTLPSQLFQSSLGWCSSQIFALEFFNRKYMHDYIIGEKALHFPFQSSWNNNACCQIINHFWWLEKVFKDQFHLFSIFEHQVGLVLIFRLLSLDLSPLGFYLIISPKEKQIEYVREVNEEVNLCENESNHMSYVFPPFIPEFNLHKFYDPISSLMEDVCIRQSSPWHDFIWLHSNPSSISEQAKKIVLSNSVIFNPILTCFINKNQRRIINLFDEWLHWIYDFT